MAEETKTEENKTQMDASLNVKDSIKDNNNNNNANNTNEIDETIQKLSETTLEAYPQKTTATTATATAAATATSTAATTTATNAPSNNNKATQPPMTSTMDNKEREQETNNNDVDMTNLIINYLPPTMSEGTLATLFSPYGLLERCKIVVDLQTLRSRGYGFVKYDNPISAERALNALNGYELNGKKLKVAFARQQCKAITNSNLYLTNIPPHFGSVDLRKLFQDFGKIIECRVLMDQNGQSRGVGFVRMDTHHNAIQGLQAMDQYVIDEKYPPLLVKLAQRRVPRRFWQDNQQNRGGQGQGGRGGGGGMMNGNKYNNNNNHANKQMGGKNKGKKQYYPNQNQRGGGGQGGMPSMNSMGGGNMQQPQQQKRGYYRPRNMNKGPYGGQPLQQQQQQQRRQGGGGAHYYPQPSPMYGDAPYGMPSYGQPHAAAAAYGHPQQPMTAPNVMSGNPPPNVSQQGSKRNQPSGNWE